MAADNMHGHSKQQVIRWLNWLKSQLQFSNSFFFLELTWAGQEKSYTTAILDYFSVDR